jgi:hypothetical protein
MLSDLVRTLHQVFVCVTRRGASLWTTQPDMVEVTNLNPQYPQH